MTFETISMLRRARRSGACFALAAASALSACGSDNNNAGPAPFATLDGAMPMVIGHRGLPGLYPEETQPSYENAADAGADSLEEDLHLS